MKPTKLLPVLGYMANGYGCALLTDPGHQLSGYVIVLTSLVYVDLVSHWSALKQ